MLFADLGSKVRHHGSRDGPHDELGGLRVPGVLLSHRPLLPQLVSLTELVKLRGDQMIEHWACQEEGDVSVNVKLRQQLLYGREPRCVVVLRARNVTRLRRMSYFT